MPIITKQVIKSFSTRRIAVIGDLILDKYIYGKVERISPEAPVPIVKVQKEIFVPGGAANVAANISALGGKALLFGIVGNDQYKGNLISQLEESEIDFRGVLTDAGKRTTLKTRVIGLNQQLLRIDHEDTHYSESHFETKFLSLLKEIKNLSAIVLSDYAKGTVTRELVSGLKEFCSEKSIPLLVDPKPKHKDWYAGSFLITPNKKEAQEMSGIEIENEEDYIKAGEKLVSELSANVIITAGAEGMYVFEKGAGYKVKGEREKEEKSFLEKHSQLTPQSSLCSAQTGRPPLSSKEGERRLNIPDSSKEKQENSSERRSDCLSEEISQRHTYEESITIQIPRENSSERQNILESNIRYTHIPTQAREVYDVSGAGDTVVATLALALSSGASLSEAAQLANIAAGIKVGKVGTAAVFGDELVKGLKLGS